MADNFEELLEKLKKISAESEESKVLTKSEMASIRRVVKVFEMLESWGKLGKAAIWLLMAIASFLIAWDASASIVKAWFNK